jgi:ankyrin repeat protein
VWGSVELADGAEHEDVVVELRCHSHAFHGSYIADREYRVVGAGDRFLFPWMLGGISPTGCTLNVYHPLYLFQYARSEPDFGHGAPSLRLETWEHLLARAEMGDDVSPVTEGDLNRHIFHMRHYYFNGLGGESERREAVRYVPALWRIYERGLELLPPMGHDRFGSMRSSFDYLRDIESELGYQRPSEQEALFAAAASGDLGAAVTALESGADIDAWNAHGAAAIHLAAREGHTELVIALIERGANIDRQREGMGSTPLLDAILGRHLETAIALIDRGADITIGAHGRVPISSSITSGLDTRLFYTLIERGAISRAREKRHVTDALHNASRAGRVELVVALLDLGIPPDASWGTTGWTALMVAAFDGQPDTARLLIEAGADVNHRSQDGRTPLSMAHQRKSAPRRRGEVLALLKGAGARE